MPLQKISAGNYNIFRLNRGGLNSWLFNYRESTIAIDPGAGLTPGIVRDAGIPPVAIILVTHVRKEHVAGCLNFPDVPVFVPEGDEYLCGGREAFSKYLTKWEPPWEWETRGNFKGHMAGAVNEFPPDEPLKIAGTLKDGDIFSFLRIISTPGHGKNALSFLFDTDKGLCCFCGDLICGADGRIPSWYECEWDYGLNGGQKALKDSVVRLAGTGVKKLFPSHGDLIDDAQSALKSLEDKLSKVLQMLESGVPFEMNFPDSPVPGFRQITPHLHQWKTGNLAVLISESGEALFVDDGLCNWVPLRERKEFHRRTIESMKKALGIRRVSLVIPTHYHGDHIENIPDLVETDGTELLSLDIVAGPMENPELYNLTCLLPWYGTAHDRVKVDLRVRSGTYFKWNEYDLEIFHLGGQTYYHAGIAVSVDGEKVIFAGDSCSPGSSGCESFICYNDAEPFSKGYAYAVERLIEREPSLLVCGHGAVLAKPMEHLFRKRAAWEKFREVFTSLGGRVSPPGLLRTAGS